jgi:hypothetical protein
MLAYNGRAAVEEYRQYGRLGSCPMKQYEKYVSLRLSTSFSNNSAVLVLFSDFNIQHNGITAKQAIPP